MDERLNSSEGEDATFSGRQVADELTTTMPESQTQGSRLDAVLQQFSDDERHSLLRIGDPETGIEFVGLGSLEAVESLASSAQAAAERLQQAFDGRLTEAFPGLKVYFAEGIEKRGGEAFADENAIVINAADGKMTVAETESFLVSIGSLDEGDWTMIANPDSPSAEIQIVHEVGHLLEAKAHGAEGVAFEGLGHNTSPTKYGREADKKDGPNNEDYPESLVYEVYGAGVDEARRAILHDDIRRVSGAQA